MATFCIDIDGTICTTTQNQEYEKAIPYRHMINKINKLYDEGHTIKMLTARGMGSGKDFPAADYYVDDKCLTPAQFANMEPK
jgi:trehalose-6-phosphatase